MAAEPHPFKQLNTALAQLLAGQAEIEPQGLGQNLGDGMSWVETVIGVLKDHLNLTQVQGRPVLNLWRQSALAIKDKMACFWGNQPGDGFQNG